MVISFLLMLATQALNDHMPRPAKPVSCQLAIYPIDAAGKIIKTPIVSPEQVSKITPSVDANSHRMVWIVTLTADGVERNFAYSQTHVGEKIAFFCGTQCVQSAIIREPIPDEFMMENPDYTHDTCDGG